MNFGKAFEQVKLGKGMRLPQWQEDVKIKMAPTFDIEKEAERSHNNWMQEKLDNGITSRKSADDGEEFMVPYNQLSEKAKELDRLQFAQQLRMTASYLYVESRFGKVPWKETMIELFAEDWEIV